MKTRRNLHLFVVCITVVAALSACRKESGSAPTPAINCNIITITEQNGSNTTTYNLSYDGEGRVTQVTANDFYKKTWKFNYSAGEYIREAYSAHWDGQLVEHTHGELNSTGMPIRVVTKSYDYTPAGQPPALWSTVTYTFEYNSSGELLKLTTKREYVNNPASNSESIQQFSWANGNLVKVEEGGSVSELEYYNDKPVQKGDLLNVQNVLGSYGVNPFKNKNLVKSIKATQPGSAPIIGNINYEFDEEGKILSVKTTVSGTANQSEIKCQYSCN